MKIEIDVPDGVCGNYSVSTFEVTERDADLNNLRASMGQGRFILPGVYKRLKRGSVVVMSNTPVEIQDHRCFINKAEGNVLINGLGLGMALKAVLDRGKVNKVTVIEISPEVVSLVGPTFEKDQRVEIINASAFDYKPPKGVRYQAVWHDIWDDIDRGNLVEMTKLSRKYASRCDWQGHWCRRECLRHKRTYDR
jgi:hypothetical protein